MASSQNAKANDSAKEELRLPPVYRRVFVDPHASGAAKGTPTAGDGSYASYANDFLGPVESAHRTMNERPADVPPLRMPPAAGIRKGAKPPGTTKRRASVARRSNVANASAAEVAAPQPPVEQEAELGAVASSTLDIVEDLRDLLTRPHSRTQQRRPKSKSPGAFLGDASSGLHPQTDWRPIFAQSYAALQRANAALAQLDKAGEAWEARISAAAHLDALEQDETVAPPLQKPIKEKPTPAPKREDTEEDVGDAEEDGSGSGDAPSPPPPPPPKTKEEQEADDKERIEAMEMFGDAAIEMDRLLHDAEIGLNLRDSTLTRGVNRALRSLCGWPALHPSEVEESAREATSASAKSRLAPEDAEAFRRGVTNPNFGEVAAKAANDADLIKGNFSSRLYEREDFIAALQGGESALVLEKRALMRVRALERELRDAKNAYRQISRWIDEGIKADIEADEAEAAAEATAEATVEATAEATVEAAEAPSAVPPV